MLGLSKDDRRMIAMGLWFIFYLQMVAIRRSVPDGTRMGLDDDVADINKKLGTWVETGKADGFFDFGRNHP